MRSVNIWKRARDGWPHWWSAVLDRLNPVHRFLNRGIEVLYAEAQPVDADGAQPRQKVFRNRAGVGFAGDFRVSGDGECFAAESNHAVQLFNG